MKRSLRDELTGESWTAPVGQKFALMMPLESKPEKWEGLEATNRYEPGSCYRITTREDPWLIDTHPDLLTVRTFRDVFYEYRDGEERKSLGADGEPGHPDTVGLLCRRHIKPASITPIGKEMNALEDQLAGLRTQTDTLNTYRRRGEYPLWQLVVRALHTWPVGQVAAGAGVSTRTVKQARAGKLTDTDKRARESHEKVSRYSRQRAAAELLKAGRALWRVGPERSSLPTSTTSSSKPPSASAPATAASTRRGHAATTALTAAPEPPPKSAADNAEPLRTRPSPNHLECRQRAPMHLEMPAHELHDAADAFSP